MSQKVAYSCIFPRSLRWLVEPTRAPYSCGNISDFLVQLVVYSGLCRRITNQTLTLHQLLWNGPPHCICFKKWIL